MKREPFDLLEFPLDGLRLIEASAGTGKTFSLAGLYLRLLVEKRLDVREILVMTFTRAATQELRERIRRRLADAARLAATPPAAEPNDVEQQTALEIIDRAAAHEPRARIAQRLRDAAARMDDATISTIHAFAQRAAQENAFESGQPFDRGTQVDDREVRREAIADYWRNQTIGRAADQASTFLSLWPKPDALANDLLPLLEKPHLDVWGPSDDEITTLTHAARDAWATGAPELQDLLEEAAMKDALLKAAALYKAIAAEGGVSELLAAVAAGLGGTAAGHAAIPAWFADLASDTGVRKYFKKAALPTARNPDAGYRPQHLDVVQKLAKLAPVARIAACRAALGAVRESIRTRKRAARHFSFADMIEALHEAITDGARGQALAAALHRNWPYALVDEFQDTDPLQYEILRRTYRGREPGALIMIGDPKQAIYGFRGGDVFAYLAAARDADGCYELDTNFRSTRGVLDGIEALFLGPAERTQQGGFLLPQIRFHPVACGREAGDVVLQHQGQTLPSITVWSLDGDDLPAANGRRAMLDATVAEICALLHPGTGARRVAADGSDRAVAPADIAVLVNTNAEAADVQRALARHGIAAVCLQRASVFASDEARHMLLLLRAVASSARPEAIRAALGTPLMGLRMGDLLALADDETAWHAEVARFQGAHEDWRSRGLLAMLEPLLQAAAPRVLALEDGERRMTNYLQLAELLARAETETFGFASLIRWLGQQIENPEDDNEADARQLRLESDDAMVRIVTVHRVKGLQYPIVFVPFAPTLGPKPPRTPWVFHDHTGRGWIDFGEQESENHAAAALEARAESLRLLYVALTRAEQACYLGWGAIRTAQNSALAWLLHADDIAEPWTLQKGQNNLPAWLDGAGVRQRLDEWAARAGGAVQVMPPPPPLAAGYRVPYGPAPAGTARADFPARRPDWSVFSFSRLVAGGPQHIPGSGFDDESRPSQPEALPVATEQRDGIALRGPAFGSAIHQLLERIDPADWPAPGAELGERHGALIVRELSNAGLPLGEGTARTDLLNGVANMISRTLHTPLPHIGRLAQMPPAQRLVEMEFFLGLGGHPIARVIDHMNAHGYGVGLPRERRQLALHGLMQGFVDLIAEADGRYWILDYKTNDLGSKVDDYHVDALRAAVAHGQYDLQYLIYLVALHRHLGRTLPGYDPEAHLGGAQYLFLRGMNGRDASTGVFVDRPDPNFLIALDGLFAGRGGTR